MSSDTGFILRQNKNGKFVLQGYWASDAAYPPINSGGYIFDTLEEAIQKYQELENDDFPSEYGLTVRINPTQKEKKMLETKKYARKPFSVDAVQITADNMEEVASWAQGEVREENGVKYVHVRVHRPLNERQTKGYVGDWVLYAGTGYKVYTDKAFEGSFDPEQQISAVTGQPIPPVTEKVQNVFDKDAATG